MDAVLRPRDRPLSATSPLAAGFGQMARIISAALGEGPPVSQRTELFRPLPDDPMAWLLTTFPTYFQTSAGVSVPLAPHHEEFWAWLWALRPGHAHYTFIGIWARGGGKSTSTELGVTAAAYFGLRRYALYVCDTQSQANDHVANVGTAMEALGIERAINRYGFSRAWNIQRLRTADGFTLDAIGLDSAIRGVRMNEARPDWIIFDDVDAQKDTAETTVKKIDLLTQDILPTGDAALAVAGVQNMPNAHGIFAQMVDDRAQFLFDREVSGPYPALRDVPPTDWYTEGRTPEGRRTYRLLAGTPVWAGQDRPACEALLTKIGPRAFEIECLHRITGLSGKVFQREWFPIVPDWPRGAALVRAWDFAATEEPGDQRKGKDPDWTVGLLMAMWRGQFWVVDVQRMRGTPFEVQQLVKQTAQVDGRHIDIWLEEEGGASGKAVTATYRRTVLVGYTVYTCHSTGSKAERAKPVSAAAEAGNVFLVSGYWNHAFLDEIPRFLLPGVHDDQVDALALAHYGLTLGQARLPQDFSMASWVEGMEQRGLESRAPRAALLPAMAALWGVDGAEDGLESH